MYITKAVREQIEKINNYVEQWNDTKEFKQFIEDQKIYVGLMNKKEFPILSSYILKTKKKAGYDINNIGHCGLAENCYTHFTSPIRRLCDLVVHMLIDYYEEKF